MMTGPPPHPSPEPGEGEKEYTAYCGLYCRDCIPSNEELFRTIDKIEELAAGLHLEEYAALKARAVPELERFPTFTEVLNALQKLRCASPCRSGGGNPVCAIRTCARERGYEGCWECGGRLGCELLRPLKDFHGGNVEANLDAIERLGPDSWSGERGPHYPWS